MVFSTNPPKKVILLQGVNSNQAWFCGLDLDLDILH